MKKYVLQVSLFLLISPVAFSMSCNKVFHDIHIHLLRPSQMEYGEALVNLRAKTILLEAVVAGQDAPSFLRKKNDGFVVPAVVSPRGEYFVTDSHHGISSLYKALGKNAEIYFNLEILKDYSIPQTNGEPWTYLAFVEDFLKPIEEGGLGKGQFTSEVSKLTNLEKFINLPVRFDSLSDNPFRSLVGEALKAYGVKRNLMKDYIDFRIGEMVAAEGFPMSNVGFTKENIEAVADAIFSSETIITFMTESSRTIDHRQENIRTVSEAVKSWERALK